MVRYSDYEVEQLVEAMDNLLDDMGKEGQSVCGFAKAFARVAFEPFRNAANGPPEYTLETAQQVLRDCDC